MSVKRGTPEDVYGRSAPQDPRGMVRVELPETQFPSDGSVHPSAPRLPPRPPPNDAPARAVDTADVEGSRREHLPAVGSEQ
jgi:hypothetical protein